jgi:hypothetical protein
MLLPELVSCQGLKSFLLRVDILSVRLLCTVTPLRDEADRAREEEGWGLEGVGASATPFEPGGISGFVKSVVKNVDAGTSGSKRKPETHIRAVASRLKGGKNHLLNQGDTWREKKD